MLSENYIILNNVLELPHTVIGATIAYKIGNPYLSLPLALLSHFALDLLPHWNPHLNTEIREKGKLSRKTQIIIVGDVVLSVVAGVAIASLALPDKMAFTYIILGAFLGVLPDVVEGPYFFLKMNLPFVDKLMKFQKMIQNDAAPFLGLLTQVILISLCVWWIMA